MSALPTEHFDTVVRLIRRGDINMVASLRHASFSRLKEIGVARDKGKAISATPKGSDQVDIQSIVQWINRVEPDDAESLAQLIAIDATAVARE